MHGTESNPVQGKKRGRIRLHEASALNDITYRGPLNCRFFQILGWFCIVVSQVVVMASAGSRFSPPEDWVAGAEPFLSRVADLALPFLLIANFSLIMNGQKNFRTLLLKNLSAAAGLFAAFTLILGHFITETLMLISQDPTQVPAVIQSVFSRSAENGFLCFNIFVDLFLCTLIMYFLNARPARFFTGRRIVLFRLLVLLPAAYELLCVIVKIRTVRHEIVLSPYLYPLLTVKPPAIFLLFVLLAAFIKTREIRFRRRGRTRGEYLEFLKTNRNSLNFSVFLAVMLVFLSLADFLAVSLLSGRNGAGAVQMDPVLRALGFGESQHLVLIVLPVLLFSYTRRPEKTGAGVAIPLAGFVLILLVYLQGILQILYCVRLPKYNLDSYTPLVLRYLNLLRR